jgi:hypothetical protein
MITTWKILTFLIVFSFCTSVKAQNTSVALTPPMGWNSYNCYGMTVHEDEVKANADYVAQNLKAHGWQYIVVDFLWSFDSRSGTPFQKRLANGSYSPWLAMDQWGRLTPDTIKFPSALGGKGFKPLADYVHSLGLKFGIHVMRGIPRQAVWAKSPVMGTNGITADMIADTNSKCAWNNHMFGLNMVKPGAQAYLNSILKLYAGWGVDFIKVDDLSAPYSTSEVEGYRKAINNCGRAIAFSTSPGATPVDKVDNVKQNANMWRVANDFWDEWNAVLQMFNYGKQWEGVGGPGHWPDCDMIQIGKLSKRGPVGDERYSRFTKDEEYSHMTFWTIFRSPLILGGNLPENREQELKLFTNDEVIAVNQHGTEPRQLYKTNNALVWYSHVPDSKDIYVALFNLAAQPQDVDVNFAQLGLNGRVAVRDLWEKENVGTFKKGYKKTINTHGAALLKLSLLN